MEGGRCHMPQTPNPSQTPLARCNEATAVYSHALSYIWVLWIPRPQNMAKASNVATSQSVNGNPVSYIYTRQIKPHDIVRYTKILYGLHIHTVSL